MKSSSTVIPPPGAKPPEPSAVGRLLGLARRPKVLALLAGAAAVMLVVAIVAPNIPQQMRRSGAFQAVAVGDYETAALELEIYVKDRPNDAEAGLQYALAALHTGDLQTAREMFAKFSGADLARRPDFLLGSALTQTDQPDQALGALDELLSQNPGDAPAHLVRGVLRAGQGDLRRARDDLLKADDLLRELAEEDRALPLAHKILLQTAAGKEFAVPPPPANIRAPIEGRIGFPLGLNGFANRYALPGDREFLRESPPQPAIPALHYANLLIAAGQFQEAETELRQASSYAPDLLMVANLEAFMSLQRGDLADAAEKLSAIVERAPESPRALLNLANIQWAENPDPARWESAAAAYDDIIAHNPESPETALALVNRGHLRALGGKNLQGAADDFAAAVEMLEARKSAGAGGGDELLQVARFNSAVSEIAVGNSAQALDNLETLAEQRFPGASRALIAAAEIALLPERASRHRAALIAAGDAETLLSDALHRERHGLLLRALWTLDQAESGVGANPHARDLLRFRRGRILAKLQNAQAAAERVESIESPARADALRAVIAAARGNFGQAVTLHNQSLSRRAAAADSDADSGADRDAIDESDLAEHAESVGEWLPAEWLARLDVSGVPVENYPRLAALSARIKAGSDPDEARRLAELAVRIWPNDFMALRNAGIALGRLGDAESALSLLDRALEGYPADLEMLEFMQKLRSESGDRNGALRAAETIFNLQNASDRAPDAGAFKMFGFSKSAGQQLQEHLKARRFDRALELYDAALDGADAKGRASLLYHRAAVLRASDKPGEAADSLTRLLQADDLTERQRAAALAARGRTLMQEDRRDKAALDFAEAAKLAPDELDYRRWAALTSAEPKPALEDAISRFPAEPEAYWDLAAEHRKDGEYEKVVDVMRRLARVRPDDPEIYKTMSEVQTTAGQPRDAAVNQQIYSALRGGN